MDLSKLLTLQERHARLRSDYLAASARHRDAVAATGRIESSYSTDLDPDPAGEIRLASARKRAATALAEVQALVTRVRASRALLDRLEQYASIVG